MDQTVDDAQTDVSPSKASSERVLDVQESQPKNGSIELRGLFQEVVEVVSRPLNKSGKLGGLLLLDLFGIKVDVVLLECWRPR